jgi:hydroxyethylthiazole kinase-like uncharacterized protein yjeF
VTELLTAAQMRAIEAAAIASGAVTGLELMERAGAGVVAAVMEEWPALAEGPHRAVVLCGPGGNGGDGFVVARLLKERGWEVEVFLHGDAERLPPDAKANCERWREAGEVQPVAALLPGDAGRETEPAASPTVDLLVDALFGTGLTRPLPAVAKDVFTSVLRSGRDVRRVVAVDVPSGLCADSGRPLVAVGHADGRWPAHDGLTAEAQLTVTFHRAKAGHRLGPGPRYCRKVAVCDIGLGAEVVRGAVALVNAPAGPGFGLHKAERSHKFTHGHALILSGPPTRTGAARLAARGALRIGAGVVTVGAEAGAMAEHAARLDAIMLREVADGAALAGVLDDRRINAVCVGPGLGLDARAAGVVRAALGAAHPSPPSPLPGERGGAAGDVPPPSPGGRGDGGEGLGRGNGRAALSAVLDADALTLLARDPDLFALLHPACVLTPHAGEFARLFPDIAAKLAEPATKGPAYSRVDATRAAAARAGCVVLFKGPDTVIADPTGRCSINSAHYDRAAPWLATAGSGDVLAGFITGLLARGLAPMQAAETGAWLHVECARAFGPGLIAEDLPEMLPQAFRSLGVA